MEHPRDEATEAVLGDIIAQGSDVVLSFLNDTDGLEGQGEEAGYDYDGSGDPMPVQEGARDDGSGDRTKSGQVYILVKPVLTS
jgi:hypothetical protein